MYLIFIKKYVKIDQKLVKVYPKLVKFDPKLVKNDSKLVKIGINLFNLSNQNRFFRNFIIICLFVFSIPFSNLKNEFLSSN